jgi:multicomponent K+:H+ antiporter subunit E
MTQSTKPITGWLAHPVLSVLLGATWLLLQQSVSPANLLFAALLALVVPKLAGGFLGTGARPRRWRVAMRLLAAVLWDVVAANLVVARLVLWPAAQPRPAWVTVPLALTDPAAMALLASIVTMTPGTVSCIVDGQRHRLLVHALDCGDPAALVEEIRQRYEAPLKEIFE